MKMRWTCLQPCMNEVVSYSRPFFAKVSCFHPSPACFINLLGQARMFWEWVWCERGFSLQNCFDGIILSRLLSICEYPGTTYLCRVFWTMIKTNFHHLCMQCNDRIYQTHQQLQCKRCYDISNRWFCYMYFRDRQGIGHLITEDITSTVTWGSML